MNFLISVAACFSGNSANISPCFLRVKLDGFNPCLTSKDLIDLDLNVILSPKCQVELSPGQKLSLFESTLSILSDFIRIYSDLPSWIEICEPLVLVLSEIEVKNTAISVRNVSS